MNWKTCFLPLLLAAVMLGSVTAFADGEPVTPPAVQNEAQTALAPGNTIIKGNLTYTVNDDGQTVTLTDGSSATGSITIPDAIEKGEESYPVTGVGDWAFYLCIALENVTFSGNVGSIGDNAFQYCTVLNTVTFFGGVDSIGSSAFESCTALENVTFPGNVGSIGEDVFWGCSALNTVTFSGDVTSIGDYAFQYCTKLTTIYVPASMPKETVQIIRDALDSSRLSDVQIVQPEQPSDPDPDTPPDPATDPSTPSDPSTGTPSAPSTGTTSTGSAVQQLEAAERPDPMDVEATERYNFWMDVKSDLRAAENGEKVRVYVPADYTNMPASVMETIRTLEKEITIDLRWNGQRLIITPQTALQRPARKAFWTFDALCEVYAR